MPPVSPLNQAAPSPIERFSKGVLIYACLIFYFASSIALTMFNKWFFDDKKYGFHFPLTVTAMHQAMVACMVWQGKQFLIPLAGEIEYSRQLVYHIAPIGALCGIDWGLSNLSFRFVTVSLYEMVKACAPIFVVLFSFAMGVMKPSWRICGIVFVIIFGMLLSVSGGKPSILLHQSFPLFGFGCLCVATVVCGLRNVLAQTVMQRVGGSSLGNVNAITTLYYVAPSSAAVLLIPATLLEGDRLVAYLGNCDEDWICKSHGSPPQRLTTTLFWLLASASIAFCLSISEFIVMRKTSALTLCVAGISKQIVVVGMAIVFFGDKLTGANVWGFSITLCGIGLYKWHWITSGGLHAAVPEVSPTGAIGPDDSGDYAIEGPRKASSSDDTYV